MKTLSNSNRDDEKIRTGISISKRLLKECDAYLKKSEFENRSELIESALKLFLVTRNISEKSEVLVPELADCITKASDKGIMKISKGLFRYAVEVEMLVALLADRLCINKTELEQIRKDAVNNVRQTKGKINLDELILKK
ncbi:MAG: hypothetical protein IJ642_06845 [Oscillospiraceae bacterium]|nr:hypothetical protein [Oscillospiraceae bacterium]